jgi:ribonucleases P/MRP protein subunit RPP40
MKSLEINEKIVSWTLNYLSKRKQRVIVRGVKSDWLEIYSGVPQGSVIGPLLFLIHINDINHGIASKMSIFADDNKIMSIVNTEEDIRVLKNDLNKLEDWCIANDMRFNSDKCSVMHCGKNNIRSDYSIFNQVLRKTDSEKDLGVVINSDMKFKDQVTAQAKKANRVLGMIKRNFECRDKEVFKILYSTLVRPHLETSIQVWSPTLISSKYKLEQIQRRATKLVKEIKSKPYQDRLSELNLMSTETRRRRGDMILTYKMLHHKIVAHSSSLQLLMNSITRGHDMRLKKVSSRLEIRKNYFYNRIVKDWNDLRQETVHSSSVDSFKQAYDRQQSSRRGGRTTS